MGSFLKFIVFVVIASFALTVFDQLGRSPASGFFDEWMKGFLLVGILSLFVMALVLSVGGITREFSDEAQRFLECVPHQLRR